MFGEHHGRAPAEQLCWSESWTRFSARTRPQKAPRYRPSPVDGYANRGRLPSTTYNLTKRPQAHDRSSLASPGRNGSGAVDDAPLSNVSLLRSPNRGSFPSSPLRTSRSSTPDISFELRQSCNSFIPSWRATFSSVSISFVSFSAASATSGHRSRRTNHLPTRSANSFCLFSSFSFSVSSPPPPGSTNNPRAMAIDIISRTWFSSLFAARGLLGRNSKTKASARLTTRGSSMTKRKYLFSMLTLPALVPEDEMFSTALSTVVPAGCSRIVLSISSRRARARCLARAAELAPQPAIATTAAVNPTPRSP